MQNNQNLLSLLNTLVRINNCRIESYDRASKETEGYTLRSLFSRLADTSRACRHELIIEITKLSGTPGDEISHYNEMCRVWNEIKEALTGKNRKAILNSCEKGEDATEKIYLEVLDKIEIADMDHRLMVKKQLAMIRSDHEKVKNLRIALLEFN